MVRELLSRGSDVDLLSANYVTPIMVACQFGYLDLVELLIENGADLRLEDENYKTALTWAIENVHVDVVMFHHSCAHKGIEILQVIIQLLMKEDDRATLLTLLNAKNHEGETPLHRAATVGATNIVENILEIGNEHRFFSIACPVINFDLLPLTAVKLSNCLSDE
ncbi:hypothetical protein AHF37_10406 [Paragonimus kellicotti]|nr:hypothetical protein AHF37_10406 [Paragonimus kellicotti]